MRDGGEGGREIDGDGGQLGIQDGTGQRLQWFLHRI